MRDASSFLLYKWGWSGKCMRAKLHPSCLTLCNPVDSSRPAPLSMVQSCANLYELHKDEYISLSCVWFFATPWTVVCQAPLSMESSRQEYWSRYLYSSAWDLPNPEIKPRCLVLQTDSLLSEPPGKTISHLRNTDFYSSYQHGWYWVEVILQCWKNSED